MLCKRLDTPATLIRALCTISIDRLSHSRQYRKDLIYTNSSNVDQLILLTNMQCSIVNEREDYCFVKKLYTQTPQLCLGLISELVFLIVTYHFKNDIRLLWLLKVILYHETLTLIYGFSVSQSTFCIK